MSQASYRADFPAGHAMPAAQAPAFRLTYQSIIHVLFWLWIASGSIVIFEPSPYDFMALLVMALWFLSGFRVHRSAILYIMLILLLNVGYVTALIPYINEPDPFTYVTQSFYLSLSTIFFVIFFAERTEYRVNLFLSAFAASCVFASILSIIGFFNIGGLGSYFAPWGRAQGGFKDPNVMGFYCILGFCYLAQRFLIGAPQGFKQKAFEIICALIILFGIFSSFSRGSWGAFVLALSMTMFFTFVTTADKPIRARIANSTFLLLGIGVVAIAVLLSIDEIREIVLDRFKPTQSYDEGEAGRFGNQLRSIPMMLERPFGFGPLRFRLWFDLEPHNSYIGAFANTGWFGGFVWITLIASTTFVGFRLMIVASPYRRLAQATFPALFGFFLQAFQIDIDHWRFVFLMLGAVWGLECARHRWLQKRAREFVPA